MNNPRIKSREVMEGLNELAQEVHKGNVERGFYEGEKNIGEILMLIVSEVSEALEADRAGIHFPKSVLTMEQVMFPTTVLVVVGLLSGWMVLIMGMEKSLC